MKSTESTRPYITLIKEPTLNKMYVFSLLLSKLTNTHFDVYNFSLENIKKEIKFFSLNEDNKINRFKAYNKYFQPA